MKFSSELNKKAWAIRKAAAKDLGVPVKNIEWKTCLEMAQKGESYLPKKEVKLFKPLTMIMLLMICKEFDRRIDLDKWVGDVTLTETDLILNQKTYQFHIKPKNWSGLEEELESWVVDITRTGKVKKQSLRKE